MFMLLETWPTQSTRDYLDSETDAPRQLRQSQMLGTSQEILKTMSTVFARVVPSIIKQMQIRVPRSTIEQHLHELLASMHFATPIPAIKVSLNCVSWFMLSNRRIVEVMHGLFTHLNVKLFLPCIIIAALAGLTLAGSCSGADERHVSKTSFLPAR